MRNKARYRLVSMTFYVRDGAVVAVDGPSYPVEAVRFDRDSYLLPRTYSFSPTHQAMGMHLVLYADRTTTTWPLFRAGTVRSERIYTNPWSMAWQKPLAAALRGRALLGEPAPGTPAETLYAKLNIAIELILRDIGAQAYAAYVTSRRNSELSTSHDFSYLAEDDEPWRPTNLDALEAALGPVVEDIQARLAPKRSRRS